MPLLPKNRPIFVGINPGSAAYGRVGATIRTLDRWADVMHLEDYAFVNVMSEPGPPRMSKVDWDFVEGCCQVDLYTPCVLSLGVFPSLVLDKLYIKHFPLPHPSGLNRKLNDRAYRDRILRAAMYYVHGMPG